MIVLDTDVVSEPLRSTPSLQVLAWLGENSGDLAITAVTVGEMLRGVRMLPHGRRREGLAGAVERLLGDHGDRVLPYDDRAARMYAALQEDRRTSGRPLGTEDGMIAAIARVHGAGVATRNTRDFEDLGLDLVDPWLA